MTAQLIDGNALAKQLRSEVALRVQTLKQKGLTPGLAVILVGDDAASQVYVRNKVKACEEAGLHSVLERYGADLSQAQLLTRVQALNEDPGIHGILVQLPLPAHIDAQKVIEAISPAKDVDGFHIASAGALMTGMPGFWPCTPHGCMKMLESIGYELRGKHAVVIGRSNIVGTPLSIMLGRNSNPGNCTVTLAHSKTRNLKALCKDADIIIAAIGKPNFVTADMVKDGVVIIDVGTTRVDDASRERGWRLVGDVKFDEVAPKCSFISPVPGGVGPMTIASLMMNTLKAMELKAK